jgi:hypothetical protein
MSQSLKVNHNRHRWPLRPSIVSASDIDSGFNVSIISSTSSKSDFPRHWKFGLFNDNYPEIELLSVFNGQGAIILVIATAQNSPRRNFITTAMKVGVKRFVLSDVEVEPG